MRILYLELTYCKQCPYCINAYEDDLEDYCEHPIIRDNFKAPNFGQLSNNYILPQEIPTWCPLPEKEN